MFTWNKNYISADFCLMLFLCGIHLICWQNYWFYNFCNLWTKIIIFIIFVIVFEWYAACMETVCSQYSLILLFLFCLVKNEDFLLVLFLTCLPPVQNLLFDKNYWFYNFCFATTKIIESINFVVVHFLFVCAHTLHLNKNYWFYNFCFSKQKL